MKLIERKYLEHMGFVIKKKVNNLLVCIFENKLNGAVTNILYDGSIYYMSGAKGVDFKGIVYYIEDSYLHQTYYMSGLCEKSFKLFKR